MSKMTTKTMSDNLSSVDYEQWTSELLTEKIIEMTIDLMPQWVGELDKINEYLEQRLDDCSHEDLVNIIRQME